jgi:hypothetical protein
MQGESYRLNKQTIGMNSEGEDRTSVFIPKNAIVTVINGPLNGSRMVDVKWENHTVMIFVEDLRERGTLIVSTGRPYNSWEERPTFGVLNFFAAFRARVSILLRGGRDAQRDLLRFVEAGDPPLPRLELGRFELYSGTDERTCTIEELLNIYGKIVGNT